MPIRSGWAISAAVTIGLLAAPASGQQSYPVKPIRYIAPNLPGGPTDILARTLGQKLSESMGQPVIVENRAGASGIIGTEAAAKSPPDGYTLLSGNNATFGANVSLFKKLPYDPIMVNISYKSAAPALTDLVAGQTQLMFATALSVMPHIRANRVRALGVTTATRMRAIPELPTIAEAGVPGFEATTWHGVLVPAGTPAAVIEKLNAEINRALQLPDVRERLAALGAEIIGGTPEEFSDHIRREIPKWAKVIKESGARVD